MLSRRFGERSSARDKGYFGDEVGVLRVGMSYDDGEEGNRGGCYDVNMAGLLYLHPGLLVVLGSGLAIFINRKE
jgi:hypothetical protein